MPTLDNGKFEAPTYVTQLNALSRDNAKNMDALRTRIYDWISKNITTLSDEDRKNGYVDIADNDLCIANLDDNNAHHLAVRFSRPCPASTNEANKETGVKEITELHIETGQRDMKISLAVSHTTKKNSRSTAEAVIRAPEILDVISTFLPITATNAPLSLNEYKDGDGKKILVPLIGNKERNTPIILAIPSDKANGWSEKQIKHLAKQLFGFAHIFMIPAELYEQANRIMGKKWAIFPGMIRKYMPGFDSAKDKLPRHPVLPWAKTQQTQEKEIESFVSEILSSTVTESASEISEEVEAIRLIANDMHLALSRSTPKSDSNKINELLLTRITLLEKELTKKADDEATNNEYTKLLEEENSRLTASVQYLNAAAKKAAAVPQFDSSGLWEVDKGKALWKVASIEFGTPIPDQIKHVSEWAKKYFPESLDICKAFQKECSGIVHFDATKAKKMYRGLCILGIYYGAQNSERLSALRQELWGALSLADIFKQEGLSSSQTGMSAKQYETDYTTPDKDGKPRLLDWHFSDSSRVANEQQMLRVYYTMETEKGPRRAIIGGGPRHKPIDKRPT